MAEDPTIPPLNDLSVDMPRPNFPLPHELRDKIYSYLLESKNVRTKRSHDREEYENNFDNARAGSRAYHFHTNVLAVNQAIHDEAEELLYKRNIFVVVNYKWFKFGYGALGLMWLPIVSDKHVSRMYGHSMRILVLPGTSRRRFPAESNEFQSLILLASDLESFQLIMQAAGLGCDFGGLAVTVATEPAGQTYVSGEGVLELTVVRPAVFTCVLRNTSYRQIDYAMQHKLLAPMSSIIAPGQRVGFTGDICDLEHIEHLGKIMSPSLICLDARKWSMFETASLAKGIADAIVQYDDPDFVINSYKCIVVMLERYTFYHEFDAESPRSLLTMFPNMVRACSILFLETIVTIACGMLRLGDTARFINARNRISEFLDRRALEAGGLGEIPAGLHAYCNSIFL